MRRWKESMVTPSRLTPLQEPTKQGGSLIEEVSQTAHGVSIIRAFTGRQACRVHLIDQRHSETIE